MIEVLMIVIFFWVHVQNKKLLREKSESSVCWCVLEEVDCGWKQQLGEVNLNILFRTPSTTIPFLQASLQIKL